MVRRVVSRVRNDVHDRSDKVSGITGNVTGGGIQTAIALKPQPPGIQVALGLVVDHIFQSNRHNPGSP